MQLIYQDQSFNVIIKRKKIKNIYFRFDSDNNLVVSANHFVSERTIEKMIKDNINSIMKMNSKAKKTRENKDYFYYLGDQYLKILDDNCNDVVLTEDEIIFKDEKSLDKYTKEKTEQIILERVEKIKQLFTYVPDVKIKIRKMKTRWGVCNYRDNIVTLNSELIKKDVSLIDYVIIHEFCHFKYHHHQQSFWEEVEKYYPYYKLARKRMKSI